VNPLTRRRRRVALSSSSQLLSDRTGDCSAAARQMCALLSSLNSRRGADSAAATRWRGATQSTRPADGGVETAKCPSALVGLLRRRAAASGAGVVVVARRRAGV